MAPSVFKLYWPPGVLWMQPQERVFVSGGASSTFSIFSPRLMILSVETQDVLEIGFRLVEMALQLGHPLAQPFTSPSSTPTSLRIRSACSRIRASFITV